MLRECDLFFEVRCRFVSSENKQIVAGVVHRPPNFDELADGIVVIVAPFQRKRRFAGTTSSSTAK